MLVRGIPPILTDCYVSEVQLQTKRLGYCTDDLIVVGTNAKDQQRKLVCQVKQTLTISSKDEGFRKTIADAWEDWKNEVVFGREFDRLAIVTLYGTDSLLRHFGNLLDCARTSRSEPEFNEKLGTPGLLHEKVKRHLGTVGEIIRTHDQGLVSPEEIYSFLRSIHVLSYDLTASTRQTEAQLKSMLALATEASNPQELASATWSDLLAEVSEGKPKGKSYRCEDLPESLRNRHSSIPIAGQQILRRLLEHSKPILEHIRSTIGPPDHEVKLDRDKLIGEIRDKLSESGLVIVSGDAGNGKSAAAKKVFQEFSHDHFAFAFRAEEFDVPHLDTTLSNAQVGTNASGIAGVLAGQAKKLLLVESVERLLEGAQRQAFSDLLRLTQRDPSWKLLLTCRSYSVDAVRTGILNFVQVPQSVVEVRGLDDQEILKVAEKIPSLPHILDDERFRDLFRSPYMLDMASRMTWPREQTLPKSEREFRSVFWRQIVRAESQAANSMPRRREAAFTEISLRRSRALSLYASTRGLDDEAIEKLRQDALVSFSPAIDSLVTPSHDVLEDWAILHWLDVQYASSEYAPEIIASIIGEFPAIRRNHRKWLGELIGRDSAAANRVFEAVFENENLPQQFRDDVIISLLQSENPGELLDRHKEAMFASEKSLLFRLLHLIRVGCKETPFWFSGDKTNDLDIAVPNGVIWEYMFELLEDKLDEFDANHVDQLLAFIEDGASGASFWTPYPAGSRSIVRVAHWLLQFSTEYRQEARLQRTLKVIARLPLADETIFLKLANAERESINRGDQDRTTREFRSILKSSLEGYAACRDFPKLVVDLVRSESMLDQAEARSHYLFSEELEAGFGLHSPGYREYFPASAYQGAFFQLCRNHFATAVNFVLELLNHSSRWFQAGVVPMRHVDPPWTLTLTFRDGQTREQVADSRLWNTYRGTSVMPDILRCAAMALERRLLEIAAEEPESIDGILSDILKRSESVIPTAVVASVATAHPNLCVESILVMLRSRDCIQLDKSRLVHESQRPSLVASMFPSMPGEKQFEHERRIADELPHRSSDMEFAVLAIQDSANGKRVQEVIDQHLARIPKASQRTEEDRIWLLSLRRMDLRQYVVGKEIESDNSRAEDGSRKIRLELNLQDQDVSEMSAQALDETMEFDQRVGLLTWGREQFQNHGRSPDPQWREKLDLAREFVDHRDQRQPGHDGPEFCAAVCIRDHYEAMTDSERFWCIETVCGAIEQSSDYWHDIDRRQRNPMSGDRPSAWVIFALLLKHNIGSDRSARVHSAAVLALTHANDEVRKYAANGAGRNLWEVESVALRCVHAIANEAILAQQRWQEEQAKDFADRISYGEVQYRAAMVTRQLFSDDVMQGGYDLLDVTDWTGSEANGRIISILRHNSNHPLCVQAFTQLSKTLVAWWSEDDERQHRDSRRQRSSDVEIALTQFLEDYVLRVDIAISRQVLSPIIAVMEMFPREVALLIDGVVAAEDRNPSRSRFWPVWQLFADNVPAGFRPKPFRDEDYMDRGVFASIFLTNYWKEGLRGWQGLHEGESGSQAYRVHNLFLRLPPTALATDCYLRFLYHIGETGLPLAFEHLSTKLKEGDAHQMLTLSNSPFILESLLRRYVYGRPIDLKSNPNVRSAVLHLLDTLVNAGSSVAFQMRDDFVTPLPAKLLASTQS